MKHRRLGRTGLKVSEICLGTMTFAGQCDETTALKILDTAADRGVTFLDTADAYPIPPDTETAGKTEAVIGRWFAGNGRRDEFVLATKCRLRVGNGPNDQGLSRRHIMAACAASLRRLQTDYIDLYQAHMFDAETPLDETLRAFDDLVRSGMVRYIGCSNYAAWQLALALGLSERAGLARYDCIQPRYNILYREIEAEQLPLLPDQGVGVIVATIPWPADSSPASTFATSPHGRGRGSPSVFRASSIASATGTPRSSTPSKPSATIAGPAT